ncbi:hypothetical protein [Wenyingzhuangia sp. IMCC45467]
MLLLFTVIMSCLSFINEMKGGKEFYPFFYWKLYTKPAGWEYTYKYYRLYGVTEASDTVRIENNGYRLFDKDDYYCFLVKESQSILIGEHPKKHYIDRLEAFTNSLEINYDEYFIVEEEFNPLDLYKKDYKSFTKIIFSTNEK